MVQSKTLAILITVLRKQSQKVNTNVSWLVLGYCPLASLCLSYSLLSAVDAVLQFQSKNLDGYLKFTTVPIPSQACKCKCDAKEASYDL